MTEIFKILIEKGITGNILIDLLIIALIVFLGFIAYLRLTKIDFNPDHFKKKKKLLELKEYNETSKDYNDYFKNNFIENRKKEIFFEIDTGISTHYKSINNYITLYNQLGKQFTWNVLKSARPYLKVNGNTLTVNISKIETYFNKFIDILIFVTFILGIILLFIILFAFEKIDKEFQILFPITLIFSLPIIFFFIYTQKSTNNALSIQKRLNDLTHTKEELNELKLVLKQNVIDIKKPNTVKIFNTILIDLIKDPSFCEHPELSVIFSKTNNIIEPYNETTETIDSELHFNIIKANTKYLIRNIDHVIEIKFKNKSVE
ncbi:hypothetical protein ACTS94_16135 [Empedobacter falsenii]